MLVVDACDYFITIFRVHTSIFVCFLNPFAKFRRSIAIPLEFIGASIGPHFLLTIYSPVKFTFKAHEHHNPECDNIQFLVLNPICSTKLSVTLPLIHRRGDDTSWCAYGASSATKSKRQASSASWCRFLVAFTSVHIRTQPTRRNSSLSSRIKY